MIAKSIFFRFLAITLSLFFILICLEILTRSFLNFEMDYYSKPKNIENKKILIHPYGQIPVNSFGFYDEEINFENQKEKIAYFGDSVTYGVGAGYPYRFTEYLDVIAPEFDHINLTGGLGISLIDWNKKHEEFLLEKKIKKIVYVMNLNDILPLSEHTLDKEGIYFQEKKNIRSLVFYIRPFDDSLRGKSMLYTFLRYKIKNFLIKKGYESSGFQAIELNPQSNKTHLLNAAKIINIWSKQLKDLGINSCVVVVPYEMQISREAMIFYSSIGIKFDNEFINFSTQEILKEKISSKNNFFIIKKDAFLEKELGYYYV